MYKSKFAKPIVFVLLAAGILQAGIMTYSTVVNHALTGYTGESAYTSVQNSAAEDIAVQEIEIPKKELDISKITLKPEVEAQITSLDAVNAVKNIKNYKTLLSALNVPESFQGKIDELYIKGHKVKDVLVAYDFLYQSYGSIAELEDLITQKESGKAWKVIFKEYTNDKGTFKPSNFEGGKLEQIFKTPGITHDDIIIADRIAQQTGIAFDELVAMRSQGMTWKIINENLGIVNTSSELPRVAITSAQAKKYMIATGLSEKEVIEALVLAQKLDMDGKAIVDKIKAGKTEEDILAESLEEKYQ